MDAWMPWLMTGAAVVLLAAIATVSLAALRVPGKWAVVSALARAALQLAALSLVLAGIITTPAWVAVGLGVMFLAAVWTAARRSGTRLREVGPLFLSMLIGPVVVMTVAFATGAIEFAPRYALALGGIIIGNTMTITILTQRIYRTSIRDHWDQVEGWLALGATPWESTRELARGAVQTALLPSLDQTRTTGLVVLPGAFVGAIFAGASPFDAGRFQIVVLAGALASGALSGVILLRLTGRVARQPLGAG
ncbi:ABC transporter permease [uncultured Microbacterium sp.]|uniref:ABC transporter permease n=1 Tax=uncultured Microbacterium sp. TaxID=191216 RepID=UPI0028D460EA|nr:ABC transporter permease [uncultured Microbacterium sp.]